MQIDVNGVCIDYEVTGPAGAPVVALSHALGSSRIMWAPQRPVLAAHYRVLAFDTRGHGASATPDGLYNLDGLADEAVALFDALQIDRVHWVGLSMGGMIGQYVALRHPARLASLTLADTMAELDKVARSAWQERIETALSLGMEPLADATMERWFTARYRDGNPPEVKLIRAQFVATPAAGYAGCCRAIGDLNTLGRLAEIDLPVQIIVGEDDTSTPPAAAQAIHARIAGACLTVIPAAAHLSNIEQARVFNDTLLRFLADR